MVLNTVFTMFLIIIIIIITSAATSDLDSLRKRSSFEDDTALSLNPALPWMADPPAPFSLDQSPLLHLDNSNAPTLFNPAQTSEDLISSINKNDLDTSDEFFWEDLDNDVASSSEIDNINGPNFFADVDDDDDDEGPFQLVDCANSEFLPALDTPLAFDTLDTLPDFDIAKSRLRRRDSGGEKCANPATTPPMDSQSPQRAYPGGGNLDDQFRKLLEDPQMLNRATTSTIENPNHNIPCFVITEGRLPWGVCSSGLTGEQERLRETFLMAATRGLTQWQLSGATLGTFLSKSLVDPL